jgi:hypothetical protein
MHTSFGTVDYSGRQLAASSYIESVTGINFAYNFLRDFYFSGISVGGNLKLAWRSIPAELYSHITTLDGQDQSAIGVMADLGILSRFNFLKPYASRDKNFSVGLSIQNLGPPSLGEALPSAVRLGVAYSPLRPWLISLDGKIPINLVDITLSEFPGLGIASAVQITDFFNIRGGIYLESGGPRMSLGVHLKLEELILDINYNLDYSSTLALPDHLSAQIRFDLGDHNRKTLIKKMDSYYVDSLVALADGDFATVIRLCTLALEIDPQFNPAQETRKLAVRSLELENQLDVIQQEP